MYFLRKTYQFLKTERGCCAIKNTTSREFAVHTTGPRRYSKLELCTPSQLESLANEFRYDVDTLRSISNALSQRTCHHSRYANRKVKRQLTALTAGPPRQRPSYRSWRQRAGMGALCLSLSVALAMAADNVVRWIMHAA